MLNRTKTYPICPETFEMMGENTHKSNKNYVLSAINIDYRRHKRVYTSILLLILVTIFNFNPVISAPATMTLFNYIP